MKYIIALLVVASVFATDGIDQWYNKELPMAKESKALYQIPVWPIVKQVRVPSIHELKEQLDYEYQRKIQEIQIKEIKRGSMWFRVGLWLAGIGFALHFLTAYPVAQRMSEWVLCGGLGVSAMGLIIKKVSEYQNFVLLGVLGCVVVLVLYKCKDWSLSHLIKKHETRNDDTTNS